MKSPKIIRWKMNLWKNINENLDKHRKKLFQVGLFVAIATGNKYLKWKERDYVNTMNKSALLLWNSRFINWTNVELAVHRKRSKALKLNGENKYIVHSTRYFEPTKVQIWRRARIFILFHRRVYIKFSAENLLSGC